VDKGESIDSGPGRWTRWVYAALLVVAASTRLVGLGHELRAGSGPMIDEVDNFVDPTLGMWTRGSLDPTICSGYAGLFNHLIYFPVGLGQRLGGHAGAYVGARAFVAVISLVSIMLMFALVRRMAGRGAALFAACLLTLSRGEIREAHQVSPDVVVAALMLGMLLLLSKERAGRWSAVAAGVLLGVAIAVKYTGILLLPGLVVGLWVNRPLRHATAPTLLAAVAGFVLTAPYAVVAAAQGGGRFGGMGFLHAVKVYYGGGLGENRFVSTGIFDLGDVTSLLTLNLGWVASALVIAALAFYRPTRGLLPIASIALVYAGALGAANHFYPRHGLVLASALTVLAGCGLASVERLRPRRGVVLALGLVALAMPAWTATQLVRGYVEDAPAEKAARWLDTNGGPKTSVVTSWAVLGVDRERLEVLRVDSLNTLPPRALETFSLILTSREAEVGRLVEMAEVVETFAPHTVLFRPRRAPEWQQAPPPAAASASEHAENAQAPWDVDRKTLWVGSGHGSWLEARWQPPVAIDAVEIDAGKEGLWPRDLRLEALGADGEWHVPEVLPLRPRAREEQRRGSRPGQLFLLDAPQTIRGLRIAQVGSGGRWGIAEIRPLIAQYH
jgi:hypothetical protein